MITSFSFELVARDKLFSIYLYMPILIYEGLSWKKEKITNKMGKGKDDSVLS